MSDCAVPIAGQALPSAELPPEADELFLCEHFGRTLAHRHCLRRQFERQEAVAPRTREPFAGPPVHARCASGSCAQGEAVRKLLEHVPAWSCKVDGTAMIGSGGCPTCAARAAATRIAVAEPRRPAYSSRIWDEPVPEPPFVPPASAPLQVLVTSPAPAFARLVPHVELAPAEPVSPEVQEEVQMASQCKKCKKQVRVGRDGVLREKCKECRIKDGEYKKSSSSTPRPTPKPQAPLLKADPVPPPSAKTTQARSAYPDLNIDPGHLEVLTISDLVQLRHDVDAELQARRERLEADLAAAREACGNKEPTAL